MTVLGLTCLYIFCNHLYDSTDFGILSSEMAIKEVKNTTEYHTKRKWPCRRLFMYPRSNVSHHHNLLNVSAKSRGKTCLHVERQYFPQRRAIKTEKNPDNENDLCSLEVAITLCYLCIKLMMFVCRIFSTYIGTNVHVLLYGTLYRQFNAS